MFKIIQIYVHAYIYALFLGAVGFGLYQWGESNGRLIEKVELEHFLKAQIYPSNVHVDPIDTTDNSEAF